MKTGKNLATGAWLLSYRKHLPHFVNNSYDNNFIIKYNNGLKSFTSKPIYTIETLSNQKVLFWLAKDTTI